MILQLADPLHYGRMTIVEGGVKGMGMKIGQIFLGELYQSIGQIQGASRECAGEPICLPFMLAGKKAQSWRKGED